MRLPVRSERDAYQFTWALVALVAISVAVGAIITPLVGVALFAIVVIAAAIRELRAPNPDRVETLREAGGIAHEHAAGAPPRLLVVANQTLGGPELRAELIARSPRPQLRIVAPILISRVKYAMSDIDTELVLARERLDECLAWARAEGFDASGEICPDGPLVAIEDQLRKFGADEIVISTHPPERSNWLEAGVVDRARAELDVPVAHVVVHLSHASA